MKAVKIKRKGRMRKMRHGTFRVGDGTFIRIDCDRSDAEEIASCIVAEWQQYKRTGQTDQEPRWRAERLLRLAGTIFGALNSKVKTRS